MVAELASACAQLERLLASLPGPAWDELVHTRRGSVRVREVVVQRWLDAEVHHVDLDVGYGRESWPDGLIDEYLAGLIRLMPALRRRPDADLSISGSWHFHRTDAAGEWTVHAEGALASVTEGHSKGDVALRASGRDLLGFLLGRVSIDDIETVGDRSKAVAFKISFPGP